MTEIYYSDGKPAGDFKYPARIDLPVGPEQIDVKFEITQTDWGLVIRIPGDVLFDFDKDVLNYKASETLGKIFKYINQLPETYSRIVIEGHTDSIEKTPGYNMDLSRRRAQRVGNYFATYKSHLDRDYRIDPPVGFGAMKPVAPNKKPDGSDNPEGREKNRRVEIRLFKK